MNETATMPARFQVAADPDPMDYMASFAINPWLGGVVAPQQLSAADAQFNMTATPWDLPFGLAMGSLQSLDTAADAHTSVDASVSPLDTTALSTESTSEAYLGPRPTNNTKKVPKAKSAKNSAGAGEDKTQRSQSLKRNRIAAFKCRQKKNAWQGNLEDQKRELEAQNTRLQREYNELLSESSTMKKHLMVHAGCPDDRIDRWIETEALRFVESASERTDTVGGGRIELRNGPPPKAYRIP